MSSSHPTLNEQETLALIDGSRRTLLLEPPYRRKYPPLGLAKIAARVRSNGGEVTYRRTPKVGDFDLVCITSLFTADAGCIRATIRAAAKQYPGVPVLVGGVAASLLPKAFAEVGGQVFAGCSEALDDQVPDYSMPWGVRHPWGDFSFTFTSRGCPNRCPYCAVWRIEPERRTVPNWREHIVPEKPGAVLCDNNLSACSEEHRMAVVDFLATEGKAVIIDSGVEAALITPEFAKELARLKWGPFGMRMAFDRMKDDGLFQEAVGRLVDAGIARSSIMAFVLYNFHETPKEADYRMRECVKLGIRPYPQQYQPLNNTTRKRPYIGKHWTKDLARAIRVFYMHPGRTVKVAFGDWLRKQRLHPVGEVDFRAWETDWVRDDSLLPENAGGE